MALGWLLNLGFAGGGTETPAPAQDPRPGRGSRIIGALPERKKKRKWTKRDEQELKRLILKAVEEDNAKAQERLEQKARSLNEVANAAAGIRQAIQAAHEQVTRDLRSNRISQLEAEIRRREIEDEEDLLLILSQII